MVDGMLDPPLGQYLLLFDYYLNSVWLEFTCAFAFAMFDDFYSFIFMLHVVEKEMLHVLEASLKDLERNMFRQGNSDCE